MVTHGAMVTLIRTRYTRLSLINREWWIGIRWTFVVDAWEINLFGLMLMIHQELFWYLNKRRKKLMEIVRAILFGEY